MRSRLSRGMENDTKIISSGTTGLVWMGDWRNCFARLPGSGAAACGLGINATLGEPVRYWFTTFSLTSLRMRFDLSRSVSALACCIRRQRTEGRRQNVVRLRRAFIKRSPRSGNKTSVFWCAIRMPPGSNCVSGNQLSEILAHRRNFLASPPDRGRPSQRLAAFPVNLVLRYRKKHLVFVVGLVHQ